MTGAIDLMTSLGVALLVEKVLAAGLHAGKLSGGGNQMLNLRLALDAPSDPGSWAERIRPPYERLKRLSQNPDGSSFHGQLDQLRQLQDVHQARYRREQQELERQLASAGRLKPQRDFLRGILGDAPIPATGVRLPTGPGENAPAPRDYELDELVGHVRSITKQLSGLTTPSGIQQWARHHRSLPDFRNHFRSAKYACTAAARLRPTAR